MKLNDELAYIRINKGPYECHTETECHLMLTIPPENFTHGVLIYNDEQALAAIKALAHHYKFTYSDLVGNTAGYGNIPIQMGSGKEVLLNDFKPEHVNIEDIAISLSNTCRFNGGVRRFISVAQHSHLVWNKTCGMAPNIQLAALLHDAAEAYIGDLITPIKQFCPYLVELENKLLAVIYEKYGIRITDDDRQIIKMCDFEVLQYEVVNYTNANREYWLKHCNFDVDIVKKQYADSYCMKPLQPDDAYNEFMFTFNTILGQL